MNPQLLPANPRDDAAPWERTLVAFLAEKERRSGSRRAVESYARMLWPFFGRVGSPETVTPAHVLAWAHGIGASGREPSSATVGARIAWARTWAGVGCRSCPRTSSPKNYFGCSRTRRSTSPGVDTGRPRPQLRQRRGPAVRRGLPSLGSGDRRDARPAACSRYRQQGGRHPRRALGMGDQQRSWDRAHDSERA
jgi:hypothetical protein